LVRRPAINEQALPPAHTRWQTKTRRVEPANLTRALKN